MIFMSIEGYGVIGMDEDDLVFDCRIGGRTAGFDVDDKGNVYLADWKRVLKFNKEGIRTWNYTHPWTGDLHSLELLPNGNLLVAASACERILEINEKDGIVWSWWAGDHFTPPIWWDDSVDWRYESKPAKWLHLNTVHQVNDKIMVSMFGKQPSIGPKIGPYLIVSRENGRIIQHMNPRVVVPHHWLPYKEGYIITGSQKGRPHGGQIIELSKEGELGRTIISGLNRARGLQLLENGHILLTEYHQVREIDEDGVTHQIYTPPDRIMKCPNNHLFESMIL